MDRDRDRLAHLLRIVTGRATRRGRRLVVADVTAPGPLEIEPTVAGASAMADDTGKPAVAWVAEAVRGLGGHRLAAGEENAGEDFLRRCVAFPSRRIVRRPGQQAHPLEGLGSVEG